MAKTKRYRAIRTEFYTVYHKFFAFGSPTRTPLISFPGMMDAFTWKREHSLSEDGHYEFGKYPAKELMVESMPVTIRAWDGEL